MGFVTITIFSKKIRLTIKKNVLLFILVYGILSSIYSFGIFGGAEFFMILIFGLSTFYYSKWFAICINVSVVLFYLTFMILYTNEVLIYTVSPIESASNGIIWLSDLLLTFITIGIGGYALNKTFLAYSQQVKEKIENSKDMHHTIENLPIPVGIVNRNKEIVLVNKQFNKYFGYKDKDILTFNDWLLKVYPNPIEHNRKKEEIELLMKKGFEEQQADPIEYPNLLTNHNKLRSLEVHHTIIGDMAICAFIDLTERKRQKRLLVETMMQAEKKENARIARELHDGIGPLLSTAKIYAHSVGNSCVCNMNDERLERLNYLLDNSILEIRNIINNIGPQILEQYGLSKAIQSFIDHIQPVSNIHFEFNSGSINVTSGLIEFAIYRTLIELINNSIKYATPKVISINMMQSSKKFKLRYKDDGIGFDYKKVWAKGFGLENINSRIENIGGNVTYTTSIGNGVCVDILIPQKSIVV
ncbi:sensor histidine kinase [Saccharicrinis carchari]|nr:histidine kinase [Saccharicrinis carchari]